MSETRCGFVALAGRPNVGKSTLLNALVGTKISIVTPRAQTTRQRLVGVLTQETVQYVFVDTPGLHPQGKRALNRRMNEAARHAMEEADVVVVLVAAPRISHEDHDIIERLTAGNRPVVLAINKIDRLDTRDAVLPLIGALAQSYPNVADIVPLSARRGENLDALLAVLAPKLPESVFLYPPGMVTDQSERQRVEEVVREKLMVRLREELPYGLAVGLEHMGRDEDGRVRIHAVIWVEQDRHKAIVIGKGGVMLKEAGREARQELKRLFDASVHLELWVKVRQRWPDDERALNELGYRT